MKNFFATLLAALTVAGLFLWLFLAARSPVPEPSAAPPAGPDPEPPAATGASTEACAAPLRWRIARLDPEFGLTVEEAREAVEDAAALWGGAVAAVLFRHDPIHGFPVHFVHDERQVRTRARLDALAKLEALEGAIEQRRDELRELVEARNQRSGTERKALGRRIRERERELREVAEEARLLREEVRRAFPPLPVESGSYREWERTDREYGVRVEREIRIFRFDDGDDLVRVVAHELGHALGLGHTGPPAIMSPEYDREDVRAGPPLIGRADRELLLERCPELR